jgi:diaminohydroxyphosphoribosylaminopyrimidine deaminase / 5-amino-6-(5-phosphoribosylamino)uracil reductase
MQLHEKYMHRCLELAILGKGNVSPNPLVGSVIVYNDKIIGEGYHEKHGHSHAEVNAIKSVKNKKLLEKATLYVNLEPCSHHGNTPPCCELIAKHKIPNVVIGCRDSSKKVDGKGIGFLKQKNTKVSIGVLEKESQWINRRFFTFQSKNRPYIILKWAQTKDGFIDKIRNKDESGINWITSSKMKLLVHQWRANEDAILVGRKTVENDNPELTVREIEGRNPLRIVIDPELKLNLESNIFNTKGNTLVINHLKNETFKNIEFLKTDPKTILKDMISHLAQKNITSIIIEGGAKTISHFIERNIWDEARVLTGNVEFKKGLKAPIISLEPNSSSSFGKDIVKTYYNA